MMILFDYSGENNLFNIVHHGSDLEKYVERAILDLDNGYIEIIYKPNSNFTEEKSLYFQVLDKQGNIVRAYILNDLRVDQKSNDYVKYYIGYCKTYYEFDDADDFYDFSGLSND